MRDSFLCRKYRKKQKQSIERPLEEKHSSELEIPTASSQNELLRLGRQQKKLKLKGVTETVAYDNMSQSQVFNPNPGGPNSNYDSLRSGHSVFTTSSLGTIGTANSAFGTVNSGYLQSTGRSVGRARGGVMHVGSLRQQPILEEPSPTGSHEDGSATASTAMGNGIDATAQSGYVSGLFSPQTQRQRASGYSGTSYAYPDDSAPTSDTHLNVNVQSPYQNGQMVVGLPAAPDGKFVSDSFLTSENPRPEADASTAYVHWALSPSAVRHV